MKRRNSNIITGIIAAMAIVAVLDILLQYSERKNEGKMLNWNNFNGMRTLKRSALGGMIGGGIGYLSYRYKISDEIRNPINSDDFLKNILIQENLKSDPNFFKRIDSTSKELKEFLWKEFKQDLVVYPENVGSFHKRTALLSNFDLDIALPFKKKNSNHSLRNIYEEVFYRINHKYGSSSCVRRQRKTIGLTIESNGQSIHFDIIPGREINDYKIDKEMNLFVKSDSIWAKSTHFKTNIEKQRKATVNMPKVREVIKLLKKYKNTNNHAIPSIVIEQFRTKKNCFNFFLSVQNIIAENWASQFLNFRFVRKDTYWILH